MRKHLPLLAICLGYFMVILDATIVNVALAAIGRDLRGGLSSLQWVVDAYTVAFAGLLLGAGALGDTFGARRVFTGGLGLFTLASGACAAAPAAGVLIAARGLQGIGAAALVPSSLALLRGTYTDRAQRARAVGAWGAIAGVGAASGPVIGGLLVALISWRAVFLVNVPVGLIALLLGRRHLRRAGEPQQSGLDPLGQLLGIVALTLLTLGVIERALPPLLAFAPVLAAFVLVERRGSRPMLPLGLFRRRAFSAASFVGLAINLGFYGQLFVFSLYFQHARHYSALRTGLALVPEGVCVALASSISGRMTGRLGPRVPMRAGLLCGAAGFSALIGAGRSTGYLLLVPGFVLAGFGMALTMPAATAAVIDAAPADRAGIASGVLNAARQTGGAIGVALLGALPGPPEAMAVSAGSFLVAALATAFAPSHNG